MTDWLNKCHFGDVRDVLRQMIADGVKVNCIVTSPPYWGLRSYLPAGHADKPKEIGFEPTLREFIATMTEVFDLARQVLADDGTLWMNMGDSYAANRSYQVESTLMNGDSTNKAQVGDGRGMKASEQGLKPKDLMGQPWRLAFALQDAGWWLRQDIIWSKPNPMPESTRDRCTKAHEYIFLMSKSERYFWNFDAFQEPVSGGAHARRGDGTGVGFGHGYDEVKKGRYKTPGNINPPKWTQAYEDGDDKHRTKGGLLAYAEKVRKLAEPGSGTKNNASMDAALATMRDTRNPRSVWAIPTQSYKGSHFATFPEALVERCLIPGCPPGGTVLDISTRACWKSLNACGVGKSTTLVTSAIALSNARAACTGDMMAFLSR